VAAEDNKILNMTNLSEKDCIIDEYLPEKGRTLVTQYAEIFDQDNDGLLDLLDGEIFNNSTGTINSNSYYLNLLRILFSCFNEGDNVYINTITTLIGQYAYDIDTIENDISQIFGNNNSWHDWYPANYWDATGWDGNKWFKICTTKDMWDKAFPPQGTESAFEDTRLRILYHLKTDEDGYIHIHQTLGKRTNDNDDPYYSRSLKWTTEWFPEQTQYLHSGGHPYAAGLEKLKKEFFWKDKMDAYMNWYNSYIGTGNIEEDLEALTEFWAYCPPKEEIISGGSTEKTVKLVSDEEIDNVTLDDINILLIEDIRYDTYRLPRWNEYNYGITDQLSWDLNINEPYQKRCDGEKNWNYDSVYFPENAVYGLTADQQQGTTGGSGGTVNTGGSTTGTTVPVDPDPPEMTSTPISYCIGYIISLGDLFKAKYYTQYGTGANITHELLPQLNGYYQYKDPPVIKNDGSRSVSVWPGDAVNPPGDTGPITSEYASYPAFHKKWDPDILLNNFKWIYKKLLNELVIHGMGIDFIDYWNGSSWEHPDAEYYLYEGKTPSGNSGTYTPYKNNQLVKIIDIRKK